MLRVMMAAPFEANGRYQGGIHAIVNSMMAAKSSIDGAQIEIVPFNTCRVERKNETNGKMSLENLRNFWVGYRASAKELTASQAEVFYMHSSVGIALLKDLMILRHVKKKTGCKTAVHIHFADIAQILPGWPVLANWVLRLMARYVDAVVFLSTKTMEQFVQRGIDRKKCHVIYNFSTLTYERQELEDQMAEQRQFLFVGSVDQRKGLFDVLEILQNVDAPFALHVCGGFGSEANEAKFNGYREKLGQKLQFHGFVKGEEKRAIFKACDVLLLPSYGEGLPVVILEAFSAGCGVVTTTVGAIPEIVGPQNGAVIEPGDQEALKEALLDYIRMDAAALQEQKLRNYDLSEEYTLDMFIQKLANVCKEVCQ